MTYNINYRDGDNSNGMLACETFYIKTEERGIAKIENIQSGLDNKMVFWEYYKYNKIAGIMGLGWDDTSFVHQLDPKMFGDDISYSRNTKSTALYKRDEEYHYYVKMQGISINNVRLNISQLVFTFNNKDSKSDWIIDSATIYSRIITPAFRILKLELKKYFSRFKGLKKFKPADNLGLELCYRTSKAEGFKNLPDITFHLQGSQADFILKAEAGFEVVTRPRKYFCLAMVRDNAKSFIGAHQQTNHRIIYDTRNKQLNFYPVDCSNNS
ncbi:hypothetical protein CASFOL_001112 [Castilleja foliolosa]|uniref:Peptidase A1 domain-containing protein n=1 Tax=Castilleja foliolosa TaxID=1961234 RepID=A0ABD3EM57_9LAMI